VTGLVGNVMVCIAIGTDRRLHNVTNYFLFSLALADMLVCLVVMPLAILVEVKEGKPRFFENITYLCVKEFF
jgi:5-hydroxytryptamine receptor 2